MSSARLVSLGTAVPDLAWEQERAGAELERLWGLSGAGAERWRRIVRGSGIERRHAVAPVAEVFGLSTGLRMAMYERCAAPLAEDAARTAIERAGVDPAAITDVFIASCTGFAAPGVDAHLVRALGLRPSVRRTVVGFMGCFGAIVALRAAIGAVAADPGAVALVVCVELCSLHLRSDTSPENLVASALFADGAAAALIAGERFGGSDLGSLGPGVSLLADEGAGSMSWRITDEGFAMTLGRDVPRMIEARAPEFLAAVEAGLGLRPAVHAVHPGGPGILEAVERAWGLDGGALAASRAVLARCGNMSSGTVLFVLEELLARGARGLALLTAFGPGLSIEGATLTPRRQSSS